MTTEKNFLDRIPFWALAVVPLVLLAALVLLFVNTNPLAVSNAALPPIENITIERITLPEAGMIQLELVNGGPDPVTIAQVLVDDAYWNFDMQPSNTLTRLQRATLLIPYPWVEAEAHELLLITNTGATFDAAVELSTQSPATGGDQLLAYALVGFYVGVIPVGLGLLWFPAMRRLGRVGMGFILSLTVGLLVFLLVDTFLEVLELSAELPGVFQGVPLGLFMALLTWLAIVAIGNRPQSADRNSPEGRKFIGWLIALGIGFHNLGEGLVVGAAFALGEAALGSFLVIGFILHNITEGVGIAAPVAKDRPKLGWFLGVLLLAGGPAIPGALIGAFAFSPLLGVIFLGIGLGAIWQVIVEVGRLLQRDAERDNMPLASWANLAGLAVGIAIMYVTAFLVKF
ncbi:MAG: metal transporter [Anaerolineae bacterium]|nr:MAG: metal transporter [Anaerolineae bacterium]